jgi:hypothetical protein
MFGRDLKNQPIFREGLFSESPVLRKFTVSLNFLILEK